MKERLHELAQLIMIQSQSTCDSAGSSDGSDSEILDEQIKLMKPGEDWDNNDDGILTAKESDVPKQHQEKEFVVNGSLTKDEL